MDIGTIRDIDLGVIHSSDYEAEIPGSEIALDFPPFPLPREIGESRLALGPALYKKELPSAHCMVPLSIEKNIVRRLRAAISAPDAVEILRRIR